MIKRILLSTAVVFALATTSWAQESGCSVCNGNNVVNSGDFIDDTAYSEVIDNTASSEAIDDTAYSEVVGDQSCASCNCDVGQDYFSNADCGSAANYKYARLFGGIGYVDDTPLDGVTFDYDEGWGAGGAIGRRVGRRRTELELSYRHNSFDVGLDGTDFLQNGNVSTTTRMANMMFDFLRIGKSNVYAGGGIGITYGDIHIVSDGGDNFDDTAFAYQGIVGIDRSLGNSMKTFVEYRYLAAEFEVNDTPYDYDAQNVFFGIEFRR